MQSVETILHKTLGSGFDSRLGPWTFLRNLLFLYAFSIPGANSASNRYEYQGTSLEVKHGRYVELTALPF